MPVCVVVEEGSVVGEGSVEVEESVVAGGVAVEGSGLAGELHAVPVEPVLVGGGVEVVVVVEEAESLGPVGLSALVSVVEVPVEVEESVVAGGVAVEGSGLAGELLTVPVESVLAVGGVEVVVVVEEAESLGAVELAALVSVVEALVEVEPEFAAGADDPPSGGAVGTRPGVELAVPSSVGVEFGAAGNAATGETLLPFAPTRTAWIAGVAWRGIATGERFRAGWFA